MANMAMGRFRYLGPLGSGSAINVEPRLPRLDACRIAAWEGYNADRFDSRVSNCDIASRVDIANS